MKIWLIKLGEPLPIDATDPRLFRTGMLARELVHRGHEVVWWSSTVNHAEKRHRADQDADLLLGDRYRLRLIHAPLYRRNVSLARIASHRVTATRFAELARREAPPDLIVSSLPTAEVSAAAVRFGREFGVPVVLDVRDLWPDLILDLAPGWARGAAAMALRSMIRDTKQACAGADAILGTTPAFVDWALGYAGRGRRPVDRDFPMAYEARRPSDSAIAAARLSWAGRGLDPSRFPEGELIACYFGAMGRQSELHTVVDAARILRDRRRSIRFVLCGTGDRLERLRRRAAGLGNVLLPGWVGAAEIWTLMRASSVGLAPYAKIPNYVMGMPNKPVEYLSAGLPVLTGLDGVLADLLGRHDCGVSYEFGRPDRLADALEALDDDRSRLAELSVNAWRLYRDRFTADRVFGAMADHLESLGAARHVAA
ncbi:glycosyltransferase family 4 protein [Tautonia sociabilis]|nr:glycosyltransferase family 4 protein [Tautonia sociabilis]